MKIRTKVETYQVVLKCDKCDGMMEPTGVVLTSNPPAYPHRCNKCGAGTTESECYPYIEHLAAEQ